MNKFILVPSTSMFAFSFVLPHSPNNQYSQLFPKRIWGNIKEPVPECHSRGFPISILFFFLIRKFWSSVTWRHKHGKRITARRNDLCHTQVAIATIRLPWVPGFCPISHWQDGIRVQIFYFTPTRLLPTELIFLLSACPLSFYWLSEEWTAHHYKLVWPSRPTSDWEICPLVPTVARVPWSYPLFLEVGCFSPVVEGRSGPGKPIGCL